MDNAILSLQLDRPTLMLIGAVAIIFGALGWALGWAMTWVRQQRRIDKLRATLDAELAVSREYVNALEHRFATLSDNALQKNSQTFLQLAKLNFARYQSQAKSESERSEQRLAHLLSPLQQALLRNDAELKAHEQQRDTSFATLNQHIRQLDLNQQRLGKVTQQLSQALRRPEVRGRWGERTLRRLLELSGMNDHADFSEQPVSGGAQGSRRPDVIVHLDGNRDIIIDAKTPMDAYLDSLECDDDAARKAALKRHAAQLRTQMKKLADKSYWQQFDNAIDFVVLFLPGDQFLSAALEVDGALLDDATASRVMIATPSSLVAMLRAVAFGWRQDALIANAKEIQHTGQRIMAALNALSGQIGGLGKGLDNAVQSYNQVLRGLDATVFPALDQLNDMGVDGPVRTAQPKYIDRQATSRIQASITTDPTVGDTEAASTLAASPHTVTDRTG